jgi:hypothetical protein
MKLELVHSNPRVCATKEPKYELKDLVLNVQRVYEDRVRSFIPSS